MDHLTVQYLVAKLEEVMITLNEQIDKKEREHSEQIQSLRQALRLKECENKILLKHIDAIEREKAEQSRNKERQSNNLKEARSLIEKNKMEQSYIKVNAELTQSVIFEQQCLRQQILLESIEQKPMFHSTKHAKKSSLHNRQSIKDGNNYKNNQKQNVRFMKKKSIPNQTKLKQGIEKSKKKTEKPSLHLKLQNVGKCKQSAPKSARERPCIDIMIPNVKLDLFPIKTPRIDRF